MAGDRAKVWLNNNANNPTDSGWPPYVVEFGSVSVGQTLLRTLVSVDLSMSLLPEGETTSFPIAWQNAQLAVAVCYSAEGPPTSGYYETVFADWLWVRQVSWDVFPYVDTGGGSPVTFAFVRNTIDSRLVDSKSRREGDPSGASSLYLVVDSVDWDEPDSSQLLPTIQWTSRILVENAPE